MRDTIDMAREAGMKFSAAQFSGVLEAEIDEFSLKAFEALVRADERSDAEGRFNALLDDYRTALETIGDMRSEHEATIKRLEAKILAEREALLDLVFGDGT